MLAAMVVSASGPVPIKAVVLRLVPRDIVVTEATPSGAALLVTGKAATNERVADFMRSLSGIVRTPMGLGRIIDRKVGHGARVELLEADGGGVFDFAESEIFQALDLELLASDPKARGSGSGPSVTFSLRVTPSGAQQ